MGRVLFAVVMVGALAGCVTVQTPAGPVASRPSVTSSTSPSVATSVPPVVGPSAATVVASPTPGAVVATLNAAANGTGSIVYIKAGDVWLASPDGSDARQLTTDGARSGYHDPTQAADGTILALQGPSTLVALDRSSGAQIRPPVTLPVLENGAEGLVVSPDAAHISYTTTGFGKTVDPRFGTPNGAFIYGGTDVATPDGRSLPNAAVAGAIFPEWVDATTLVMSDGTRLYLDPVGGQPSVWLDLSNGCLTDVGCPADQGPAANLTDPAISADDRVISAVYKPYYGDGGRLVGRLDASPPSDPASTCVLPGQENFSDPGSFAPGDSAFAYDDTSFDPNTLTSTAGQGIHVLELDLGANDCGASSSQLVIAGGAQPEWGPLAP
ncbi:MAG TPA: hypothetical protein VH371_10420 [Candidatus Limnocylindrales bacterium]